MILITIFFSLLQDIADKGASRDRSDSPANLTNGPGSPTVIVTSNKANPPNASASARV